VVSQCDIGMVVSVPNQRRERRRKVQSSIKTDPHSSRSLPVGSPNQELAGPGWQHCPETLHVMLAIGVVQL